MKKRTIILMGLMMLQSSLLIVQSMAQPAARRNTEATKANLSAAQKAVQAKQAAQAKQKAGKAKSGGATGGMSQRALISFPTQKAMQEDVVWRRDIYREVDLTEGTNSGLYYPVEPVGSQMNLFTYMFKLMLSGQIPAYEYRLDGNESFESDAKVKPLAFMDNYGIYYERKDGKLKLDNSDIPSREVKSYYIKECSYFDQQSATFHTKVVALCPIMSREDDFGAGTTKYPLFWVKYDDVAPFLSKQVIMTSNLNNAATMSVDDYFVKNMYKGKIYKTNNMLGQTLSQYCPTDSAMEKERNRIEAELKSFEKNVWGDQARKDSLDSIAKANVDVKGKKVKKEKNKNRRESSASSSTKVAKKPKQKSSPAASSAARVSVRRQRH